MSPTTKATMDEAISELRTLPPDERCEAIIGMFSMVVAEFATMVLEHCEATPLSPQAKRVASKLKRRIRRRA